MSANTVVNCAAYCEGRRVANVGIDNISEVLKQPDKFVWIGLHEPSAEMLSKLQREFGLHDLAIEDAHRAHQRPKIEAYGDSLFVVLRTVQMKEQQIELGETHFFVGHNFIITVRHGSSLSYTDVRARCESTPHLLKRGPGFALYAIMDSIVDQYFPVVDSLALELETLEEKIFDLARKTNGTLEYLIVELIDEHRILTAMFSALQEAKNKPEKMNTLGELLTSHIRKEERQLFPLLEQTLTADQFLEIDHLLTEKTAL